MSPDDDGFEAWTRRLVASVTAYDEVVGLILLGSTADPSRADRWSDHDFYLVVRSGQQERFRGDLAWLPDADRIVLAPRETEHGLKVMYDDGHVLEFAVADAEEVLTFGGTPYRVGLDRAGLTERLAPPTPGVARSDKEELELFAALLVIGAGRAARGEELSAGQTIREYAAMRLVTVLARRLHPASEQATDPWNPLRRFEALFPVVGAEVTAALEQRPLAAARALLAVAVTHLGGGPDFPHEAAAVVTAVLDRADAAVSE